MEIDIPGDSHKQHVGAFFHCIIALRFKKKKDFPETLKKKRRGVELKRTESQPKFIHCETLGKPFKLSGSDLSSSSVEWGHKVML